jgi:hypothetical protein
MNSSNEIDLDARTQTSSGSSNSIAASDKYRIEQKPSFQKIEGGKRKEKDVYISVDQELRRGLKNGKLVTSVKDKGICQP